MRYFSANNLAELPRPKSGQAPDDARASRLHAIRHRHQTSGTRHQPSDLAGWPRGLPPEAPTDPDVRISRIRFVRSRIR